MPIRTILLHMGNDDRHLARLEVGLELARRHGAHLDILYVAAPAAMPAGIAGRGASYAYLAEATAIAHEKAAEVAAEVAERCGDLPHTWTVVEGDPLEVLTHRASYADLAILSQSHPDRLEDRVLPHLPDRLPVAAACPSLVLPWAPFVPTVGTDALIAWKNTREASRAVRQAIPLLQAARTVTILTVAESGPDASDGDALLAFLERHGVRARHRHEPPDVSGDAGSQILAAARQEGSDLLVMGAYGHSRLRELVVGGVTRHVLEHMDLPVLMAH